MSGVTVPTPNPLYPSTSAEKPQLLCIDFTEDPTGSLGAQLVNFDKVRKLYEYGWLCILDGSGLGVLWDLGFIVSDDIRT